MRHIFFILFISLSISSFSQIELDGNYPEFYAKSFENIKMQNVDTCLIYFTLIGPWSDVPDSCERIPFMFIQFMKNGKCSAKEISCSLSTESKIKETSFEPIKFFLNNESKFYLKKKYLDENKFIPYISSTDITFEYLIYMTNERQIKLVLSEDERYNKDWQKEFPWINPTITMMDKMIYEIKNSR
jgi:hypothetical protein